GQPANPRTGQEVREGRCTELVTAPAHHVYLGMSRGRGASKTAFPRGAWERGRADYYARDPPGRERLRNGANHHKCTQGIIDSMMFLNSERVERFIYACAKVRSARCLSLASGQLVY